LNIEVQALGEVGEGKTEILKKIAKFLEDSGFAVFWNLAKREHAFVAER